MIKGAAPLGNIEFKLIDVPEFGFKANDMINNINYPRGEICIRGSTIFKGYYKNPEKTREIIDKDGWLHTGDIGKINPNGALQFLGRKKHIFSLKDEKLIITPEKIENIYRVFILNFFFCIIFFIKYFFIDLK